jgi:hypothetical protein
VEDCDVEAVGGLEVERIVVDGETLELEGLEELVGEEPDAELLKT